jgi:serine phosphatase RsbU (regulator of sigma subunit)
LIELIEQCRSEAASQICARVLDSIREFRGAHQDQDDVTIMVVKRSWGSEG